MKPAILLRLVVYGTLALLGLGAYVARTHAEGDSYEPDPRTRLTGTTDHGVPTWADVRDGKIVAIDVTGDAERIRRLDIVTIDSE